MDLWKFQALLYQTQNKVNERIQEIVVRLDAETE